MSQRTVSIEGFIGRDHYRTMLQVRSHTLVGDEPVELGGSDQGPMPDELLLCSLATCKIITIRLYADRKEWPLERIHAHAEIQIDDTVRPVKSRLEFRFSFEGDLDEQQRARLLDIADKCPTHRLLMGEMEIVSVG
jgi:putative redox protein